MKLKVFIFSILTLSIFGCKVEAPLPQVTEIAIPEVQATRISKLDIPISISIDPILNFANTSSDPIIRNPEWPNYASFGTCEGPLARYEVDRGNLKGYVSGNQFVIGTTASYSIEGNYCTNCVWGNCVHPRIPFSCGANGESKRRIQIEFTTNMAMDGDYKLLTSTYVSKLQPIDPCNMTFLNIDMTNEVLKAMRPPLDEVAKYVDQQTAATNVKAFAQQAWDQLNVEMPIEGYGYLRFNPIGFRLGPIQGFGNTIQVSLGLDAQPEFSLESKGNRTAPLPGLAMNTPSNGFEIHLPILASYEAITFKSNEFVSGKTFTSDDGKKTIFIHEVKVEGIGNKQMQLTVRCDIKSGWKHYKNCTFYFTGTPKFDAITNKISMSDLTLDSESNHMLMKMGISLFQSKLSTTLQQAMQFDLTQHLADVKAQLETQLNKQLMEGVNLQGSVKALQIDAVYPEATELQLHATLLGELKIQLVNFPMN